MGLAFSRLFSKLIGKHEVRILMVGLDAAGKTVRSVPGIFRRSSPRVIGALVRALLAVSLYPHCLPRADHLVQA